MTALMLLHALIPLVAHGTGCAVTPCLKTKILQKGSIIFYFYDLKFGNGFN
jgi:hypothetical protein